MKPTPPGWPRLSVTMFYDDPAAAIDFLERAFGFETRIRIDAEDGGIEHSELMFGEAVVMVSGTVRRGQASPDAGSPASLGGRNTASLFLYVDDADAHCARARAAGARVVTEPTDSDYGEGYWADCGYEARDLEGHRWYFAHRVRTDAQQG